MSTRTNVESVALEHGVDRVARRARHLGHDDALRPSRAFRSDDLPTFGRPRIATLIASSPTGRSLRPGSRRTISSSRSPVPWPWSAESGIGSPRPSRWNSSASSVPPRVVELVREHEHRLSRRAQDLRELLVARRHPRRASTTKSTRSASSIAAFACSATCGPNGPVSSRSTPPVSMSRKCVPAQSHEELLAVARDAGRLVDDGRARLRQPVDERGLADVREADDRDRARELAPSSGCAATAGFARPHRGGVASRGRPSSWTPTSHSQSSRIFRSTSSDASL